MSLKLKKPLHRSRNKKVLCGVMAGFAESLGVDVVLLRAIYVLMTAFTGFFPGIAAYIVLCLVMPEK